MDLLQPPATQTASFESINTSLWTLRVNMIKDIFHMNQGDIAKQIKLSGGTLSLLLDGRYKTQNVYDHWKKIVQWCIDQHFDIFRVRWVEFCQKTWAHFVCEPVDWISRLFPFSKEEAQRWWQHELTEQSIFVHFKIDCFLVQYLTEHDKTQKSLHDCALATLSFQHPPKAPTSTSSATPSINTSLAMAKYQSCFLLHKLNKHLQVVLIPNILEEAQFIQLKKTLELNQKRLKRSSSSQDQDQDPRQEQEQEREKKKKKKEDKLKEAARNLQNKHLSIQTQIKHWPHSYQFTHTPLKLIHSCFKWKTHPYAFYGKETLVFQLACHKKGGVSQTTTANSASLSSSSSSAAVFI